MPPDTDSADADILGARQAVWTRYWASGAVHSFGDSGGGRYQGPIAAYWRRQFAHMRAGQRMLDLATGNGALPRLLIDARPGLDVSIDAVDLAAVEPAWTASLPAETRRRLRFHSGVQVEALPFASGSHHLVTSQYGVEYSDLARAVPEVVRVAVPGGHLALLVHVAGSRPVALAGVELSHLDWLLGPDDGLMAAAADLLEPLGRAATPQGRAALAVDAQASRIRDRFNAAQDTLKRRVEASSDGADILLESQAAVGAALSLALQGHLPAARRQLLAAQLAADDSRLRLQQLRHHALSRHRMGELINALRTTSAQGVVDVAEIREHGHLMGCTVSARKASR